MLLPALLPAVPCFVFVIRLSSEDPDTGECGYSLIFDLYTVFSPAGPADLSPPVAKACLRSWMSFAGGSMRQGAPPAVHERAA